MEPVAAWMALAYRCPLPSAELERIALAEGPRPEMFPPEVLAREEEDRRALADLGVRLLTLRDDDYPPRLRGAGAPLVLQVAGHASLLDEDGVAVLAGHRGPAGEQLADAVDGGSRAVLVLAKGMLKARSLLRALHEPLADGSVALVSAEPPRASWGPARNLRRDALCRALRAR